jgi:hypothetical protein
MRKVASLGTRLFPREPMDRKGQQTPPKPPSLLRFVLQSERRYERQQEPLVPLLSARLRKGRAGAGQTIREEWWDGDRARGGERPTTRAPRTGPARSPATPPSWWRSRSRALQGLFATDRSTSRPSPMSRWRVASGPDRATPSPSSAPNSTAALEFIIVPFDDRQAEPSQPCIFERRGCFRLGDGNSQRADAE